MKNERKDILDVLSDLDNGRAVVYGRVQSDVRDFFRFTLAWDEFPCARLEELRLQLRRMHRRALKEAREVGFAGSDTWTQPPLPLCGVDEEEEDTEAVVPAGGAS